MNTTHQELDRTSVIALALTVVTLAVVWVANMPAAPQKQAAQATPVVVVASEGGAAPAEEGRYKVVVTGLRLRPVTPTAVANVGSGPRT